MYHRVHSRVQTMCCLLSVPSSVHPYCSPESFNNHRYINGLNFRSHRFISHMPEVTLDFCLVWLFVTYEVLLVSHRAEVILMC